MSVLYVSSATRPFPPEELAELLRVSRQKNHGLGVTGMLLHKEGNFMQVLEGDESAVRELFGRIDRDPRHRGVIVLRRTPIEQREFGEWSMAYCDLDRPESRTVQGYSDFLMTPLTGREFTESPTLCQRLMLTFKRNLARRGAAGTAD